MNKITVTKKSIISFRFIFIFLNLFFTYFFKRFNVNKNMILLELNNVRNNDAKVIHTVITTITVSLMLLLALHNTFAAGTTRKDK